MKNGVPARNNDRYQPSNKRDVIISIDNVIVNDKSQAISMTYVILIPSTTRGVKGEPISSAALTAAYGSNLLRDVKTESESNEMAWQSGSINKMFYF